MCIVVLHPNILEHKSAVFTFCLPSVFRLETVLFVTVYFEFLFAGISYHDVMLPKIDKLFQQVVLRIFWALEVSGWNWHICDMLHVVA